MERNPGPRSPAKSPKKELGLAQVGTGLDENPRGVPQVIVVKYILFYFLA